VIPDARHPSSSGVFVRLLIPRDARVEQSLPRPDLCGNCRRLPGCIRRKHLSSPYVMDAESVLSYMTIGTAWSQWKESASRWENHVFGCDICRDVCRERRAPIATIPQSRLEFFPPAVENSTTTSRLSRSKPNRSISRLDGSGLSEVDVRDSSRKPGFF